MDRQPFVYIMASKRRGTLYVGVTSDLPRRAWGHREGFGEGFSARYGLKGLFYFEEHGGMCLAVSRERQLKKWLRRWKVELIEGMNPDWADLRETVPGGDAGAPEGTGRA